MLTPVEIQSKSFKSGGLGYDKKDVDGFMREVLRSYEELYRQNMEQKDKISTLGEGINYYKTIEKTLQKALVLAEKTAEETKLVAQKESKRIVKEAEGKANIILADARNELDKLHNQTIALIQQYEKYKAQFRHLAAAQMDMLETEAFNINLSRLDAFIDVEAASKKSAEPAGVKASEMEEESFEDVSKSLQGSISSVFEDEEVELSLEASETGASDDNIEGQYEFNLSNYEVEGQEEFDYLDLDDPES